MSPGTLRLTKVLLLAALLAPIGVMAEQLFTGGLGPNPIEEVLHRLGLWTLRTLLLTLAVTPLRRLTGWNGLIRYRRLLGLTAFAYGSLHLLAYVGLDQFFDLPILLQDLTKRPFIYVGLLGWLCLLLLAVTSTRGWVRRLGRNWTRLHRLVYLAATAGAIHFWWSVKKDIREPAVYAGVLLVLLAARLPSRLRRRVVTAGG
jgi:sulfoxide reductase heme-binding subunit YedZ